MSRKIVITSGKGGVGKTTITANLGIELAGQGNRVALIDIDFGLNNLDVVMGLENKATYDILDVLEGRCRIKQALLQDERMKNLFVLPSGNVLNSANISGQDIRIIIDKISELFDYILIDCPAGIDLGFHRAVSCADEAIVVVTPHLTSLRDSDKVCSILKSYKLNSVKLVVNRVRGDLVMEEKQLSPFDIKSILKIDLLGVLPEEDEVFLSCGYSLSKFSQSHKGYKILANNIIKGDEKLFDVTSKYSGFFGSIRRSIKKGI